MEGGGVDTKNFVSWAYSFIEFTEDLRGEGRTVTLVHDGYCSPLSLQVLEAFHKNRVIVDALPSHTSGKTQPLDKVLFAAFKAALNKTAHDCTGFGRDGSIDIFGLCSIIRESYDTAFTRENIKASFRRSGLWPVDARRLLGEPRPESGKRDAAIVGVDELTENFEHKTNSIQAKTIGSDAVVLDCGYVDTTNGCVMTSEWVLELVRKKKEQDRKKRETEERVRLGRELRAAKRHTKLRNESTKLRGAPMFAKSAHGRLDSVGLCKERPLHEGTSCDCENESSFLEQSSLLMTWHPDNSPRSKIQTGLF